MAPMIGHTIFFTCEKNRISFPAAWACPPHRAAQKAFLGEEILLQNYGFKICELFPNPLTTFSKTKKMTTQERKLSRTSLCFKNFRLERRNITSMKQGELVFFIVILNGALPYFSKLFFLFIVLINLTFVIILYRYSNKYIVIKFKCDPPTINFINIDCITPFHFSF